MATKKICDRCGAEIKSISHFAGLSTYKHEGSLSHELCDSCAFHLGRWLKGKEKIEREHYCKNVCRCAGLEKGCSKDKCSLWKAPAADVVEVVRCKDCKHRRDDEDFVSGHYCVKRPQNGGYFCEDEDFCSCGERRDNNAAD